MKDYQVSHPLIMCTLTPAQIFDNEQIIKDMHLAGMSAVRINTAHLDSVNQLGHMAVKLKSICPDVMILIDTKGPEMRTTSIANDEELSLSKGMAITLIGCDIDTPSTCDTIYVNYPNIHSEINVGDLILIDDGKITLCVDSVHGRKIEATVITDGMLGAKKGLAVKGVNIDLPAVSQQDRTYIRFAAESDSIDMVAHSFVRNADDVLAVRDAMGEHKKPIIAKIENQQGIDSLMSIIKVADGILIARGDLTASIGAESIPLVQQYIAEATKRASLPLFLATNILPSLMYGKEISQVDFDGIKRAMHQSVDVMLLTNETASGHHPLLSVQMLHRLISQPT